MLMPTNESQNYSADTPSWGKINVGTLKIDPEMAGKSLEDILADAKLLFNPLKVNTTYVSPVSGKTYTSKAQSIIRDDTDAEVGNGMGGDYTPVGYLRSLEHIFGDVTQLGGIPTRCVSFKNGAKAAIQFVLPGQYFIGGQAHATFFNVYGSMDGTTGVGFNGSDTRIVCGNTWRISIGDKRLKNFARHTQNVGEKLSEMASVILAVREQSQAYYTLLSTAISTPVNRTIEQEFLNFILPSEKTDGKRDNAARINRRNEVAQAIATTLAERNTSALTVYDVFQGALRYSNYKTGKRNEVEQLEFILSGPGATFNDKAFSFLQRAVA